MKNKLFFLCVISVYLFTVVSCAQKVSNKKINVISTIFPLYEFVKEVGKGKVNVSMILPPGAEAHSFEPTPQDIVKINESSMFIYTGEEMEPWAHDIIKSLKNQNLVILEACHNIKMLEESEHRCEHEKDGHKPSEFENNEHFLKDKSSKDIEPAAMETEEENRHHHGGKDPHIWLDFEINQKIVLAIAEELSKLDPANKDFYKKNAEEYNAKLAMLDKKFKESIEKCELKTIMYGGHFAFGYLAKRYGLTYISPYKGFSPNSEPTPQKIAELIDLIKKNKIEYLYYEELLDPKVAKSISNSTGVNLELLHGAHNVSKEELKKNVSFLQIMEDNLLKLKKGLKYKE